MDGRGAEAVRAPSDFRLEKEKTSSRVRAVGNVEPISGSVSDVRVSRMCCGSRVASGVFAAMSTLGRVSLHFPRVPADAGGSFPDRFSFSARITFVCESHFRVHESN